MIDGKIDKLSNISEEFRNTQAFFEKASTVSRIFIHPAVHERLVDGQKSEQRLTKAREAVLKELATVRAG